MNIPEIIIKSEEYPAIQKTRIMMINGLLTLMQTHAVQQISIKNLVEFSQVSRKSFYRHYTSKEDILKDFVRLAAIGYLNSISPEIEQNANKRIFHCFKWCKKNRVYFEVMDNEFLLHSFLEEYSFFRDYHIKKFMNRSILAYFYENSRLNRYYDQYNYIGFLHTVFSWIKNDMDESEEEMTELCLKIMRIT